MCDDSPQSKWFLPAWLLVLCLFTDNWSALAQTQTKQNTSEFLSVYPAFSEVPVSEQTRQLSLGRNLSVYEDSSGQLQINELLATDERFKWRVSSGDVPNFGYSESVFWFALQLKNVSSVKLRRLVEIGYPLLDSIVVYRGMYAENKMVLSAEVTVLGDSLPFSQRIINHRNFLIPVDLSPGQRLVLFFRVEGGSAMQFPVKLWEEDALFVAEQATLIYFGFCFGGILIMLVYNLFLFFSLGDKSYLYFVFTLSFFLIVHASFRGLSYQFLWPNFPALQAMAIPLFVSWGMASLAALSIILLSLKCYEPYLYRIISGVMWLLLLSGVLAIYLENKSSTQLAILLTFAYGTLGLIAGVRTWLRGFTPAFLLTIAFLLIFLGTFLLGSNKFGMLPRNVLTEYGQEFGFLLESLILAAALASKISVLRRAKEDAERITRTSLEEKVMERTKEVNEALEQLELTNRRLSKMSREDGLTHLLNRRAFDEFLATEWRRSQRSKYTISLILGDIDHFKAINDRYGHLAGDDCLRQISTVLKECLFRPGDNLFRFGGEEFAVLLPETDLEGAAIVAERLRVSVVSRKIILKDCAEEVSMSFGVATAVPTPKLRCQNLIFGADQALYRAKDKGRNRVELTNSVEEHSF